MGLIRSAPRETPATEAEASIQTSSKVSTVLNVKDCVNCQSVPDLLSMKGSFWESCSNLASGVHPSSLLILWLAYGCLHFACSYL